MTSDKSVDRPRRGFLQRLLRDERAATLPMMAASILPLMGMVGGAVDISRMYLVKTRLQQACDAGVLAARRVMVGTSAVADNNAVAQADAFFNANLADGAYGAEDVEFEISDVREGGVPAGNLTGRVAGAASASVPMTLMSLFTSDEFTMNATCEANLNIANNDIMFVLDLTGSMGCRVDGTGPCGQPATQVGGVWRVPEDANARIVNLRAAVGQFFTTLNSATPDSARLRIGFVPYSSGVNVAGILPANSLAATHTYRSRAALFDTPFEVATGWTTWSADSWQVRSGSVNQNECLSYNTNNGTPVITGGGSTASNPETQTEMRYDGTLNTGGTTGEWSWTGANDTSGNDRSCRRRVRTRSRTYTTQFGFTQFVYGPQNYNVANNAIAVADLNLNTLRTAVRTTTRGTWNEQELAAKQAAGTATGVSVVTKTWGGDCIEERAANANIDLLATDENTRWKPARPDLVYYPSTNVNDDLQPNQAASSYACTMPAQRLQVMTQAQINAYIGNPRFAPHGSTYHDVGMIWGTRLMSLNGAFAADHTPNGPNGRPVQRHLIFMTDGEMAPRQTVYGLYGVEQYDRRIVGTGSSDTGPLTAAHNARFLAACNFARNTAGISVWTVAYGTARTPELTQCADNGQDLLVDPNDPQGLQNSFATIAQRIADLRLSQ